MLRCAMPPLSWSRKPRRSRCRAGSSGANPTSTPGSARSATRSNRSSTMGRFCRPPDMTTLASALRKQLENTVRKARTIADDAAADVIERLGIAAAEAPAHLSEAQKALRCRLRAHARALGDRRAPDRAMTTRHLAEAAAYEHWHRMLFGRFLVERSLLIHPRHGVPIARDELKELAEEEGFADEWALVERFAAPNLPGVFKPDDPVLALELDPHFQAGLRALVTELSEDVFAADDSLGWTYQFWRADEKKRVNDAQVKIGADELPAVTQLFTEPYMVKFLLHNTLGAWWAGKVLAGRPDLAREAEDESALREACALPGVDWEYLRFVREADGNGSWRPAAGTFSGWPRRAAEITYLDPCCGSGHFLVEVFAILAALRQAEEGLPPADAARAVLRDNLHGLEIDGRCVQIAAFSVALAAWRLAGGQVRLPVPHIAWVGAPPPLPKSEFVALANGDAESQRGLAALHDLFRQAPFLGSLIELTGGDLIDPTRIARLDQSIAAPVEKMRGAEPERAEGALAARGMADAAAILARRFTLLATNPPFLGRGKQEAALADYLAARFASAKADLATAMLMRMHALVALGGTFAAVTPQNWLFLSSYKELRKQFLRTAQLNINVALGPAAFQDMNWWAIQTALAAWTASSPDSNSTFLALDADTGRDLARKPEVMRSAPVQVLKQTAQLGNPDARITLQQPSPQALLGRLALSGKGSTTGDSPNYHRYFWEYHDWSLDRPQWLDSPNGKDAWSGRSLVLRMPVDRPPLIMELGCWVRGQSVWGKKGVVVNKMRGLEAFFYDGEIFDDNVNPIVPNDPKHLPAIWAFCSSSDYASAVRRIDRKLNVTNTTLVKVPFDLAHWQKIAAEKYPNGLPEPYSDDPTQWLFHGHPRYAEPGTELHV